MDTDRQLYEAEATGWQRGVYDDVKATLRAPFVNWIFRTLMANEPGFTRYFWGQIEPLLSTEAVARFTAEYRDTVLAAVEDEHTLPAYRREEVDLPPAEYAQLRGQLATFDIVGPRLALVFEAADRALHGEPVGDDPDLDRAVTAPMPEWVDRDRGTPPTLTSAAAVSAELEPTVESIRGFHGFEGTLPSVYRCLLQWPAFVETLWRDLEPVLSGDAFADACERAEDLTAECVDSAPYAPRLAPADLERRGLDRETIDDLQTLFREFNAGAVRTVLPALPVYAATVDAVGRRAYAVGGGR